MHQRQECPLRFVVSIFCGLDGAITCMFIACQFPCPGMGVQHCIERTAKIAVGERPIRISRDSKSIAPMMTRDRLSDCHCSAHRGVPSIPLAASLRPSRKLVIRPDLIVSVFVDERAGDVEAKCGASV